ncbi:sigma-70 family RNA polymerase sigma factor [Clostridium sp. D2Q-11]|uniref:Sigma-70 family RNA polymerase sigma factor n=1 Tax=Anaeromonas frigoriresistens TaxID=2683708 RepID=A0A942Z5P8_9FIRM|nr:sigma-70 family RNA polymerase sigma factor [Anaeromonas frigoriresistens]MBS4537666.1 sigma-70 family RNA polymerase sigma factor [Anaeromonas frigoriresistens]
MPTDEELIEEIHRGSQAAMEVLVKKYYKNIFSYIYRKVGDYHISYDLTQEVFIKMMKSIDRYESTGKFKNWLLKIAVNHCNDYYKSKSYKNKSKETQLEDRIGDNPDKVWDLLKKKIERNLVKKAIMSLPDYQRDVLILRYYHDMKLKDIADITSSKEATVKSRLRQGIGKLNNLLGGEDIEERKNRL